jgi:hypothetical protein
MCSNAFVARHRFAAPHNGMDANQPPRGLRERFWRRLVAPALAAY